MRIAITETLDPDGALVRWASPDLAALGHEVVPLPVQELASVLGAHGLCAWTLAVVRELEPDLLIALPPYDHVSASTWAACRALGTRVIGFAMDEPLFSKARARTAVAERYRSVLRAFDRVYVSAPDAAEELIARGLPVRWLRWALSPASLTRSVVEPWATDDSVPAIDPSLADRVVLVGRPYERRIDLLRGLAEVLPVFAFGPGWEHVPAAKLGRIEARPALTGPAMHAVLAMAGAVVTSGDWEATPIAMVKARLLEAAFAGARQVAQDAPDLDAYFSEDELPRYRDGAELAAECRALLDEPAAARARAERARRRALAEHTWSARFAEIAGDLGLEVDSSSKIPAPRSDSWIAGLSAAASFAEQRGSCRRAAALYHAAGDAMGLARNLLQVDPAAAARAAAEAIRQRDAAPTTAVGLYSRVVGDGPALGHVGFLDPIPELEALHLTALLATGDVTAASSAVAELIARGDPDRLVATAAVLSTDGVPAHAPVWRRLFASAATARPAARRLLDEHRARFTRELAALAPP